MISRQIAEHRRHKDIDAPEQVVLWDTIIEPEFIEQARLIDGLPTHHRRLQGRDSQNGRKIQIQCAGPVTAPRQAAW